VCNKNSFIYAILQILKLHSLAKIDY